MRLSWAVVGKPEAELQAALDRIVAAGLLFQQGAPPHTTYLFKHALVQVPPMARCCACSDAHYTPASLQPSKAISLTLLRTSPRFWRVIALRLA